MLLADHTVTKLCFHRLKIVISQRVITLFELQIRDQLIIDRIIIKIPIKGFNKEKIN